MGQRRETSHFRSDVAMQQLNETYTIGRLLGQGAFGVVNLIEKRSDQTVYACKIVKKRIGATSAYEQQEREVKIMKKLRHENILELFAVYEGPKSIALVLELCSGGEILKVIRGQVCSDNAIRAIISQLVAAVGIHCLIAAYLHRNRIIHRDLKPENILLKSNLLNPPDGIQIKVADFGLACFVDGLFQIETLAGFKSSKSKGTPMYMAPEIIHKLGYNHSCDIWSIGVMLYLFLCNGYYNKKIETMLNDMIKAGKVDYPIELFKNVDPRGTPFHLRQPLIFAN